MLKATSSSFKTIEWPVKNVQAFSTTIHNPLANQTHNLITSNSPVQLNNIPTFGAFNLGVHVGDNLDKVHSNRQSLLNFLPSNSSIQWLEQVHSNIVVSINQYQESLTGDALVTQERKLALAIMTADCLPIILSTLDGQTVAAIHGGWKPLSTGVIDNTVQKMKVNPQDLHVWLGPCIGNKVFEVGVDVYNIFKDLSQDYTPAFKKISSVNPPIKYLADLHVIARIQLNSLGITHIYSTPDCTYSMKSTYYSYRRQKITGRMATIICRL